VVAMSEDWKDDRIEWYAEDLLNLGYIFNQTEWDRFREALDHASMEFFLELQIDDETFNLGRAGL